jgi:hypothetical protein
VQAFDITLELGRDGIGAAFVRFDAAGGADDACPASATGDLGPDPEFLHFLGADLDLTGGLP